MRLLPWLGSLLILTPGAILVAPAASATLDGDKWTPVRDAEGFILQSEWDGLPLNRWIELVDSSLQAQLVTPFGAPAGYSAPGTGPTAAHYAAYTGCGWDEANGRCYHFGGGHADGGNNMLTEFDLARGKHRVVIPPTHQSLFPAGYAASGNLSTVNYASGKPSRAYHYFPSGETPAGDDKPCASHEYSGIVFVPGISEVLLPRFGWFHATLPGSSEPPAKFGVWRVGPQTIEADRKGFKKRTGIAFHAHYLKSTGLVYLTSEGGQTSESAAYYSIVKYDPAKRQEVGAISFDSAGWQSSSCLVGDELWYFQGDTPGSCKVTTVNLATGVSARGRTNCSRCRPEWADGANPVQFVPTLDKVLMWCTKSRAGEAQSGDLLEFDRATLAFKLFPVAGTPPPSEVREHEQQDAPLATAEGAAVPDGDQPERSNHQVEVTE